MSRVRERLDIAAVAVRLARVPQVDDLAFTLTVFSRHRPAAITLPIQDHERHPLGQVTDPRDQLARVEKLRCDIRDIFDPLTRRGRVPRRTLLQQ
jgi:hypothetical protein